MSKKDNGIWVKERIKYFWNQKRTYENTKANFESDKAEFYDQMDRYFDSVADDDGKIKITINDKYSNTIGINTITCQRISQTSVKFDIEKLKKLLTKQQAKKVVKKEYKVKNWPGLLKLLKESGVDWNEFLKYVSVSEVVKEEELDKMVDLGEVDIDNVKSCCTVKVKSQYYKITESEKNKQGRKWMMKV